MAARGLVHWFNEWHERHIHDEPLVVWSVLMDEPLGTIYTVDANHEDVTVLATLLADGLREGRDWHIRPSTRSGVSRIDLDPPREHLAVETDAMGKALVAVLEHNKLHGELVVTGHDDTERRRF